jgi:hypothetical protein
MAWPRWISLGREGDVSAWSGLRVPAAARVISAQQLHIFIEAAEHRKIGSDTRDIEFGDGDAYFLLPYSYEHKPLPIWKCRVIAFQGGLSVEVGKGKTIRYGRLDIPCTDFRRLSIASRTEERQLLHLLAWKAAAAEWKAGG